MDLYGKFKAEMEFLKSELIKRIENELSEYKNHLMSLSKEEIMLASYETGIKECIAGYITSEVDNLTQIQLYKLATQDNALEALYKSYMDSDLSLNDLVRGIIHEYRPIL